MKFLLNSYPIFYLMARSSSGLGHRPLKAEITGSKPVRATPKTYKHAL